MRLVLMVETVLPTPFLNVGSTGTLNVENCKDGIHVWSAKQWDGSSGSAYNVDS